MFKKIEIWILYFLIVVFIVVIILYGSLLKHHYSNGEKFPTLRNFSVFVAEIPSNFKLILSGGDEPPILNKFKNKPKFKRFIKKDRNDLLILPRYNSNLKRFVVDLINVDNFEKLHTFSHDINKFNKLIKTNRSFHQRLNIDHSQIRFIYWHPEILDDASLISNGATALFRIDKCGNLIWFNNEQFFHHSVMLDQNKDIWASGTFKPDSNFVSQFKRSKDFMDDGIFKLDVETGKILFQKSIIELLFQNNILNSQDIFDENIDPIHVNDIEPIKKDGPYWKKDDLFISIRNQSAIILYRPSTNKILKYIKGPFFMQHDVDVISDKEISIFNNNNSLDDKNKFSEILIYNFESNSYKKKFNESLIANNFKTTQGGMAQILSDGSMFLDEQDHGRLIFLDANADLEWEYVNKSENNDNIYHIRWSKLITDQKKIEVLKKILGKKCLN